jgi:hypothetical protein
MHSDHDGDASVALCPVHRKRCDRLLDRARCLARLHCERLPILYRAHIMTDRGYAMVQSEAEAEQQKRTRAKVALKIQMLTTATTRRMLVQMWT